MAGERAAMASPAPVAAYPQALPSVRPALGVRGRTLAGVLLWGAAVCLAWYAQYQLVPVRNVAQGWLLYGLAAALVVAGVTLIDRGAPAARQAAGEPDAQPDPAAPARPALLARRRVATGWALVAFAAIATGLAAYLPLGPKLYLPAILLWLAALLSFLIGVALMTGVRWPRAWSPPGRGVVIEIALLVAILGLALALRLPDLLTIPPFVHTDEANVGTHARLIMQGTWPNLFETRWYDTPALSFAIQIPTMALFGDNLYGLRLATIWQSLLALVLLYLLARHLFSPRVATLATFFMAVSFWEIHYSRFGITFLQAQWTTLLLFWLLLRAVASARPFDYALAGLAAGLCFEVYFAARLSPVLAVLFLGYLAVTERGFLARHWNGLLAMAAAALLFVAPLGAYYVTHPEALTLRSNQVSLFGPALQEHLFPKYQTTSLWEVLRIHTLASLQAFNLSGEASDKFLRYGPLLDLWSGALFVLGLAVAIWRLRRPAFFLLVTWFGVTLLVGSILTIDALSSQRVIALLPMIVMCAAVILDAGWRGVGALFGRAGRLGFAVPALAVLILSAQANYREYFLEQVPRIYHADFLRTMSDVIAPLNDAYQIYLITQPGESFRHDLPRFLIPNADGVEVRDQPLALPLERVPAAKGVAFLVTLDDPRRQALYAAIQRAYPGGREWVYEVFRHAPLHTYLVEHDELLRARPDARIDPEPIPGLTPEELAKQRS
jgi:4-amino-4-deoxy-L-arabinose transferase-like glycosyltransferase